MFSRLLARLGPYALSVLITFAVGLVSVPALIHLTGATAWAGLAVIQSIAALTTVVVSFGWGAVGPNMIAILPHTERQPALVRSVYARAALYLIALPVATLVAIAISGLPRETAIVATFGYTLQSLGLVWYFVGEARPLRMLYLDALPRALGVLAGIAAVWITKDLLWFAASVALAAIIALAVGYAVALRNLDSLPPASFKLVWRELIAQRHGVITTTMASLYYNSSLIIVSVLAPASLETFALAFKLYNYAGAALVPVLQFAQGWLPVGGREHLARRLRLAVRASVPAGLGLAVASFVLLPLFGSLLSVHTVQIPWPLAMAFAICIGAMLVNQVVGQAGLVAIGRAHILAVSTTVGALAGTGVQVLAALIAGGLGVAVALAAVDVGVAMWQLAVVCGWLKRAGPVQSAR